MSFTRLIRILSFIMVTYHIIATKYLFIPVDQHKNIHLTFCLILILVTVILSDSLPKWRRIVYANFAILTLAIGVYVHLDYYNMVYRLGYPNVLDTILGVMLIIIVLEVTRLKFGLIIPVIVILTLIYGLYGRHLPGILFHGGLSIPRLIAYSTTYFRGVYGSLIGLSATVIFPFILFAVLIENGGGKDMLFKVANRLGGSVRSGPAQAAVVSSALMGMISGSTAANVASTGSFTIPLMKRHGYSPEFAGAVECIASTGGQILPPIMGISAFLIVGITGIPYYQVAIASLGPALIYYLSLSFACEIRAVKRNLKVEKLSAQEGDSKILASCYHLIIPILVLVYFLVKHYSAGISAFYAIICLICLMGFKIVYENRHDLRQAGKKFWLFLWESFNQGALTVAPLAAVVACLGIIIEMTTATGLGQKLSFAMIELSGGNQFFLLVLAAITAIIFGMGMPTPGAYMLVALLGAPAMINFGIDVLTAHLFVFYFAALSALTPPVAIAPLVASGISGGSFLKTALTACRLGLGAFMLPFYFVFRPEILQPHVNFVLFAETFIFILIALFCLSIVFEQYFITKSSWWETVLFLLAAILMFDPELFTSVIGLLIFISLCLIQAKRSKRFFKRWEGIKF